MHDAIETQLRQAVEISPSDDGLRWLDQRVAEIIARPRPTRAWALPRSRTFLRPLAVVAALVVVTGTVVGAMGLLERTVDTSPGWRTAWDRAQVLALREKKGDTTLTLERAYVDRNQVMVFLSVEGLSSADASGSGRQDVEWSAALRGPGHRQLAWTTGTGAIETDVAAIVQAWGPPVATAGTYELTIACLEIVRPTDGTSCSAPLADPWRFEFDLLAPSGIVVDMAVAATVEGATATLTELKVTSTMVSYRIALRIAGTDIDDWQTTNATVRRGGDEFTTNSAYHVTQDPSTQGPTGDVNEFSTTAGSDTTAGTWEVVIPEISYTPRGATEPVSLKGPWTFEVDAP